MFNIENYKNIMESIIPFHKVLGLKLIEMREGYASILIPFRSELVGDPRTNRVHGGVLSTALDAAGGAVGITTLKSEKDLISTINLHVDYLNPGKPEDILVEGMMIKEGSNLIFTHMKARHIDSEELIAEARAVYRVRKSSN
jgi:uncharacterized protein (TIGR00369 family)